MPHAVGFTARPGAASGGAASNPPVAGYVGWYDASDTSSLTVASNLVSQWNDKSGGSHHLTQGTGANQPNSGTRTQNGLNAVLCTRASPTFVSEATFQVAVDPGTILFVAKSDSTGLSNAQAIGNGGNTPTVYQSSGNWAYYNGTVVSSGTAVDTGAHCVSTVFARGSSEMWLDGSSIATGDPNAAAQATKFTLGADPGGASGWDGLICEVIVYQSALSTTDRQTVEAYLKAKWATP